MALGKGFAHLDEKSAHADIAAMSSAVPIVTTSIPNGGEPGDRVR